MKTIIDLLERKLEQRTKELNTQEEIFYTNSCKSYHRHMFRNAIDVNRVFISECTRALSILKSENEVVVSDAQDKHGDLPRVGKRNASGDPSQSPIASEQGALDNRIGFGNLCPECNSPYIMFTPDHYFECTSCDHQWT